MLKLLFFTVLCMTLNPRINHGEAVYIAKTKSSKHQFRRNCISSLRNRHTAYGWWDTRYAWWYTVLKDWWYTIAFAIDKKISFRRTRFFGRGRRDRSATHPSCGARNLLTAWSAGKFRPRRFVLLAFSHTVSARNLTRHSPRASGSTLSLVKTKDTAKAMSFVLAGAEGIEPSALGFGDRCSTSWAIPLYKWWTNRDSNPGPTGYEPVALTNWAIGPHLVPKQLTVTARIIIIN